MAKEIRRIEIEPAVNGGHTVTHHYKDATQEGRFGTQYSSVEPEHHVFGAKEGHAMLAHLANRLEIPESAEGESKAEGKAEGAAGERAEAKGRLTAEKAKRVRENAF